MITIYLEMFNGDIIGWGSQIDNAPCITIPTNHPFFQDRHGYELVDGELVKKN